MDTEIDWQRELDSSFGSGADVPAGHYVAAGRRAVRRRRTAAAVTAVVLVIGSAASWLAGPHLSPEGSRVASTATADPSPTSAVRPPAPPPDPVLADSPQDVRAERPDDRPLFEGAAAVAALGDGELVVQDGWRVRTLFVVEVRRTPSPARTWGIVAREDDGPGVQWIYLRWSWGGDVYTISEAPGDTADSFGAWLPLQRARASLR